MKIQCDVCNKYEASVFCTADEAALCDGCDHRVHHANKLASKHQRFSLIHPSSSSKLSPLCDICQERRALLFCLQDRAILCRECDIPIHSANEHTQNHHRFLFTGVKLSATSTLYSSSSKGLVFDDPKSVSTDPKAQPLMTTNKKKKKKKQQKSVVPVSSAVSNPTLPPCSVTTKISSTNEKTGAANYDGVGSMSSISEYLTETLPGWHVEDLLDFSSNNHSFGFCKGDDNNNNEDLPFFDDDIENNLSSFSSQNLGIWVPQAPNPTMQHSQLLFKENHNNTTKEDAVAANMNMTIGNYNNSNSYNRSMWNVVHDCFTVPQISPPSVGSKRFRHF